MARKNNETMTWQAAEEVLESMGKEVTWKAIRVMQLRIKYTIALFVFVAIIVATKMILAFPITINFDDGHKWAPCKCFYSYDIYGRYTNESPFTYHCTVHGHDCDEE